MNELNPADIFCKTVKVCMPCYIYPDGNVVTVVDVLHITHAAIATVSGNFCLDLVLNVCVSYAHAFGFEVGLRLEAIFDCMIVPTTLS